MSSPNIRWRFEQHLNLDAIGKSPEPQRKEPVSRDGTLRTLEIGAKRLGYLVERLANPGPMDCPDALRAEMLDACEDLLNIHKRLTLVKCADELRDIRRLAADIADVRALKAA